MNSAEGRLKQVGYDSQITVTEFFSAESFRDDEIAYLR